MQHGVIKFFHLFNLVSAAIIVAGCGGGDPDLSDSSGSTSPPADAPITVTPMVAAGYDFSLALKKDGTVFSWGDQLYGQLGNGNTQDTSIRIPERISGLNQVVQISTGAFHSLARRTDGTVWAWGANGSGRLGLHADGGAINTPQHLTDLTRVVAITAGRAHSLALRDDGTVLSWGDNSTGQLGLGDTISRLGPTAIPTLSNIKAIAAGGGQSFAIHADGTVLAWGNNLDGQLGLGDTVQRNTPATLNGIAGHGVVEIAAGQFHTLARTAQGTIWSWGSSLRGQTGRIAPTSTGFGTFTSPGQIPGITNATTITAGSEHSIARLSNGTLRTWGHAGNGRLGNATSGVTQSTFVLQTPAISTVMTIAAGDKHGLAVLTDGRIGCFGDNFRRQCGRFEITDLTQPVEVGPGFNLNLDQ